MFNDQSGQGYRVPLCTFRFASDCPSIALRRSSHCGLPADVHLKGLVGTHRCGATGFVFQTHVTYATTLRPTSRTTLSTGVIPCSCVSSSSSPCLPQPPSRPNPLGPDGEGR